MSNDFTDTLRHIIHYLAVLETIDEQKAKEYAAWIPYATRAGKLYALWETLVFWKEYQCPYREEFRTALHENPIENFRI